MLASNATLACRFVISHELAAEQPRGGWEARASVQRWRGVRGRLGRVDALPRHHEGARGRASASGSRFDGETLHVQDEAATEVSVFRIVGLPNDPKLVAARNGVKRLRTVRGDARLGAIQSERLA